MREETTHDRQWWRQSLPRRGRRQYRRGCHVMRKNQHKKEKQHEKTTNQKKCALKTFANDDNHCFIINRFVVTTLTDAIDHVHDSPRQRVPIPRADNTPRDPPSVSSSSWKRATKILESFPKRTTRQRSFRNRTNCYAPKERRVGLRVFGAARPCRLCGRHRIGRGHRNWVFDASCRVSRVVWSHPKGQWPWPIRTAPHGDCANVGVVPLSWCCCSC